MSCRTRKIRTMRSKASLSPARLVKVSRKRRSSEKAVAQVATQSGPHAQEMARRRAFAYTSQRVGAKVHPCRSPCPPAT